MRNWIVTLVSLVCVLVDRACFADTNSGCPSWGCLPWGSFSLSSGIPAVNSSVSWRVGIEEVSVNSSTSPVPRGCVSDQQTVVCTTQRGYVSVDFTNGKKLWNYTTKASPYLPIMDINSNVIGMDVKAMYNIGAGGKPKRPIAVGVLKPGYSLMVGNNSIMFVTGTTNKTAQVVTYGTDGIVDGSTQLLGSIEMMNGSFIPCSQPIIAGFRAYVMTYFVPDDMTTKKSQELSGMLRLYAIDITQRIAKRIVIAWHFNFGRWSRYQPHLHSDAKRDFQKPQGLDPIVTYFNGTVYINVPEGLTGSRDRKSFTSNQPWPGSLWAVKDGGKDGSLVFKTSCVYGPMAVFDTYDKPLFTRQGSDEEHLVWVMNRSPAILLGYDSCNGTVQQMKNLDTILAKLGGWITSSLSITRSNDAPKSDQLVFGISDSSNQARLVVVQVDNGQAKLVLSRVLSTPTQDENRRSIVEGQIVNFAFYPPSFRKKKNLQETWKFGLAAIVTDLNSTTTSRSIVAVF